MATKLGGVARRRLSMTSLIDVIFLLLLFFMLTSTFSKFAEIELISAGGGSGPDGRQMLFVSLSQNSLMLNGQQVEISRIADLIGLQPQDSSGHLVLINLDDTTSSQRLVDLLTSLRLVDGLQTMVLG